MELKDRTQRTKIGYLKYLLNRASLKQLSTNLSSSLEIFSQLEKTTLVPLKSKIIKQYINIQSYVFISEEILYPIHRTPS